MSLIGFIELDSSLPVPIIDGLAQAAYRASGDGIIGLALRDLDARSIDRRLDPLVRSGHLEVLGVRYIEAEPVTERLLDLAAGATFVVASSGPLKTALDARGIRHLSPAEGLRLLSRPSDPRAAPSRAPSRRSGLRGAPATI